MLILTFILVPIILIGCKSELEPKVSTVNIYVSNEIGKVNYDHLVVEYEDHETLEIVENLIESAVKEDGIVDMVQPHYDLEIIYSNGDREGYHLWVGEPDKISMIMKVEDTHSTYSVSGDMTTILRELVQ